MRYRGMIVIVGLAVANSQFVGAKGIEEEVRRLREENRQMARELKLTRAALQKIKDIIAEVETAETVPQKSSEPKNREMNAPLPIAQGEETPPAGSGKKDFLLLLGAKTWLTEWNTWRTPVSSLYDRGFNIPGLTSTSNSEVSVVPNLTLRYQDWFVSGSYLAETEYRFARQSDLFDIRGSAATLDYQLSGTRREWDVTLGYQFLPYAAITMGYKEIQQRFRTDQCTARLGSARLECGGLFDGRFVYAGPTLGISGSVPIRSGFGLYGNFSYGWLGANYRDDQGSVIGDVDYYVGEFGVTYTHAMQSLPLYIPFSAATAYAGYRYQSYESEIPRTIANGNRPKDVVQGFVSGINLAY